MITTYNGCYRSEIKVTPRNWNTVKASVNVPWRINYRFYDPAFKDHPKLKKGKQVKILGMNHFASREDRQAFTRRLIEREKNEIDVLGYNPITKIFMAPSVSETEPAVQDLTPSTPFISALNIIYSELSANIEPGTNTEFVTVLKYFSQSAILLKKDRVPLEAIKARDIKHILENCKNLTVTRTVNKRDEKNRVVRHKVGGQMMPVKVEVVSPKTWNDNEFNKYRKCLSALFTELERQEIIEYNPIKKIPKRDTAVVDPDQAQRKVLSPEERRQVHLSLILEHPAFHRFINIFYHSGARISEIMRLQGKNVDMVGQRFKVLVKKRKKLTWVWKTIKDVALPYWQEIMQICGPEDYVFAKGLLPGKKAIRIEQVGRRWKLHIKKKLGITSRMYDLKHLHTTEVINELEKLQAEFKMDPVALAAEHNSHTSSAMVVKIYDVDSSKREHRKVKGLKNVFAS